MNELKFTPRVELEEGIRRTIKDYKKEGLI